MDHEEWACQDDSTGKRVLLLQMWGVQSQQGATQKVLPPSCVCRILNTMNYRDIIYHTTLVKSEL